MCWDNTLRYRDSYENIPKPGFYIMIFCQGRQLFKQFCKSLEKSLVAFQHSNLVGFIIGTSDIVKVLL